MCRSTLTLSHRGVGLKSHRARLCLSPCVNHVGVVRVFVSGKRGEHYDWTKTRRWKCDHPCSQLGGLGRTAAAGSQTRTSGRPSSLKIVGRDHGLAKLSLPFHGFGATVCVTNRPQTGRQRGQSTCGRGHDCAQQLNGGGQQEQFQRHHGRWRPPQVLWETWLDWLRTIKRDLRFPFRYQTAAGQHGPGAGVIGANTQQNTFETHWNGLMRETRLSRVHRVSVRWIRRHAGARRVQRCAHIQPTTCTYREGGWPLGGRFSVPPGHTLCKRSHITLGKPRGRRLPRDSRLRRRHRQRTVVHAATAARPELLCENHVTFTREACVQHTVLACAVLATTLGVQAGNHGDRKQNEAAAQDGAPSAWASVCWGGVSLSGWLHHHHHVCGLAHVRIWRRN